MKNTLFAQFKSLRWATPIVLLALATAPVFGQGKGKAKMKGADADPDRVVQGGELPAGWNVRPDRGTADQEKVTSDGGAFNFTMGPAGTFWNPAWTKNGDYSYSARLTQTAAPSHAISYGLMIGGSNLAGPQQTYTYFLVRNQGEYFIANRDGEERSVVVNWTANPAIAKQAADGTQANVLGIQVQGANVIFSVNGTEVQRLPKADVHADGLNGFRIGHNLDVRVDQVQR